jgi:hypothetical protein
LKLVAKPLAQIDDLPAHEAVDRRVRAVFDDRCERGKRRDRRRRGVGGVDDGALGQAVEKRRACRTIGDVAAGEQECEGTAVFVRQSIKFSGSASARTANRLVFLTAFPPAAERWAFTAEESIINFNLGPP